MFVTFTCNAGIDFSPERPPSSLQLFKLLANTEFRKGVQKLRDDLAKAGVNVDPEVRGYLHNETLDDIPYTLSLERDGDAGSF
jgi:hypothetical protein